MTESILYQRSGHVGRLTLNNPERHNALGREQLEAMQTTLAAVAADDQVRALIITGSGEKTFCAGASLQELSAGEIGDDLFQQAAARLAAMEVPTICAMNGDVFGGGVELAVSCDFRIGVEGSKMRVPAAAIGLCYPLEGIQRFVQCLGVNLTRRILVASEEFDAAAMLQIGFLDRLVLRPNLQDTADAMAQHIGGLAPLAVRSMKEILRQIAGGQLDSAEAAQLVARCLGSEDIQEGFAAKREKRAPRFAGR